MNAQLESVNGKPSVDMDGLFDVIKNSLYINRHMDFFMWLQGYVTDYIPHDILVATWGDFNSQVLHYDVTSNVPEIHTQQLAEGCYDIDPLMRDLHKKWLYNENKWFVLTDFDELSTQSNYSGDLIDGMKQMRSVLVYGYRDNRGGNFFIEQFAQRHIKHFRRNTYALTWRILNNQFIDVY